MHSLTVGGRNNGVFRVTTFNIYADRPNRAPEYIGPRKIGDFSALISLRGVS
jgi:hypothetical protein